MSAAHAPSETSSPHWRKIALRATIGALFSLAAMVLFAALFQVFHLDQLIEALELKTYDFRTSILADDWSPKPSDDIVLVTFDDPTLMAFNDEFGGWPWPRQVHADLLAWLHQAGVSSAFYDIMFIGRNRNNPQGDVQLAQAFGQHPNLYMAMNLDNNFDLLKTLGKTPNKDQFQRLAKMALPLDLKQSALPSPDAPIPYYPFASYNNCRYLQSGLMQHPERTAIVNHVRDMDGVSRSNALLFRLFWPHQEVSPIADKYLPYYGLRLVWDQVLPQGNKRMVWDPKQHHLVIEVTPDQSDSSAHAKQQWTLPLTTQGALMIRWYNRSHEKQRILGELSALGANRPEPIAPENLSAVNALRAKLNKPFLTQPYPEVPVWKIIRAMRNEKAGKLTMEDKALKTTLKNKFVFVGTTAVATYDIKTTPISRVLPGVVLQAVVFDNIKQQVTHGEPLMHRASPSVNSILTIVLGLFCIGLILKIRSASLASLAVLAIALIYIAIATVIFRYQALWLNIAGPMISIILSTAVTFAIKYVNRTQDYDKTYVMATTDAMTGLYNHRYFQEQLSTQIEYSQRYNEPFALILIDIDHFKKFNDTYGHQAGDAVLRAVAKKLKASVRGQDIAARYGGEEMAIILHRTNAEDALEVAHKLVTAIAEAPYPIADGISKHVTISAGVASYPQHAQSNSALIEAADQGLYAAKAGGRNQVGPLPGGLGVSRVSVPTG